MLQTCLNWFQTIFKQVPTTVTNKYRKRFEQVSKKHFKQVLKRSEHFNLSQTGSTDNTKCVGQVQNVSQLSQTISKQFQTNFKHISNMSQRVSPRFKQSQTRHRSEKITTDSVPNSFKQIANESQNDLTVAQYCKLMTKQ